MKKLLEFFADQRKKSQLRSWKMKKEYVENKFNIRESNGKLYIVCDLEAIIEIDETMTAADIVTEIRKVRTTCRKYKETEGGGALV